MQLPDLNFTLPKELIAQKPAHPRDHARLLVYSRSEQTIIDSYFYYIEKFLPTDTTLAINEAKVDKCRMQFDNIEVFVLDTFNNTTVQAMVKPGKKFKLGLTVKLTDEIEALVTDINPDGHRTLEFNHPLDSELYEPFLLTPLPPYVKQDESLAEEYQTVYAKQPGSKAAPTAGLHFTPELLDEIKKTHPVAEVTLNVGLGTFAPLTDEHIKEKRLHEETYSISEDAAKTLNDATHITAVGTTTTRLLESMYRELGHFEARDNASTDIFIQPGDTIESIDALITNFHLPSTSLLMMIAALTGPDELMRIYRHAIAHEYRFYSFGDAMLIV